MTTQNRAPDLWARLPVLLRAIISSLVITLAAVNVWPLLRLSLGVRLAAIAEVIFVTLYRCWASGGGGSQPAAS
jgi:hypothetical protein